MVSREFANELMTESAQWVEEGLLTPAQAEALRFRYEAALQAAPREDPSTTLHLRRESTLSTLLYGTAGILLGAATIAFAFVIFPDIADSERLSRIYLVAVSFLLLAGGVALRLTSPNRALLADALLLAPLVPLLFAAFFAGDTARPGILPPEPFVAAAVALPLFVWRRSSPFLQPLGLLASGAALGACVMTLEEAGFLPGERQALFILLALYLGLLVAVLLLDRRDRTESTLTATLAGLGVAGAFLAWFGASDFVDTSVAMEIALGLAMLALMGLGMALRHRGPILAGALVLCVDAIVFAFDVGGVFTGTVTLLALAGLLIWQAEFLKSYLKR